MRILREFRCDTCNHYKEVLVDINDAPECDVDASHGPMKRLISASSFQFKSGGVDMGRSMAVRGYPLPPV